MDAPTAHIQDTISCAGIVTVRIAAAIAHTHPFDPLLTAYQKNESFFANIETLRLNMLLIF